MSETTIPEFDRAMAAVWMAETKGEFLAAKADVERILADANARLAAVEALAEEWRRGPGPNPRWLNALETALDRGAEI